MASTRRLAAIMFTDLVGSTAIAQQDEKVALSLQVEQERLLRPIFAGYGGREVKSMGDGFLVEFDSALRAVECAAEVQRVLHERNSDRPAHPLQVRIGVHLGDVEERNGDIFGDAVNIAARVEPLADIGGVCVSEPVEVQLRNKLPYRLEKLGPRSLKGVRDPVEAYRVVLPWVGGGPPPGGASHPRLAVLPFANISPDAENEYFADGLTEELITVLSRIRELRVISRTSVGQYKGTTKPVAQIGSELGVDAVLEGSVRKSGDRLRIAVQLIDTLTDGHRWAQTYDRKLEDVFGIQAEVAEATATALKVELLKPERLAIRERPTTNLEAYELYLRGIQASERFATQFDRRIDAQAVKYLEEAITLDPGFSAAYFQLANHLMKVMGETRPTAEVVPRIRQLVAKTLELSPNSSDAHGARAELARQVDLDWAVAETEFRRAIELNPGNATARDNYGGLLFTFQRYEEAKEQYLAALEQDPLSLDAHWMLASLPAYQGDLEAGISNFEKLARLYPEGRGTHGMLGHLHAFAGHTEAALKAIEPLSTLTDQLARENHAVVLALVGRPEEARAFLAEWEAGRLPERLALRYVANLCAALGENERALALLEQDAREGDRAIWHVYQYATFDRIRKDPRFVALLEAQHLPTSLKRPLLW